MHVAVIGGGYGDEGKGKTVAYWASILDNTIVVRYNGGAQAGHTVVTKDNKRHVFSHFGSGSINNIPTYLSEYYVVNPTIFKKEYEEFVEKFGFQPEIYVSPKCLVTSPYEMLLNQSLEKVLQHGSVGVGFGETLEKTLMLGKWKSLQVGHLGYDNVVKQLLKYLKDFYIPKRIDITKVSSSFVNILNNEKLFEDFKKDYEYFLENVFITETEIVKSKTIVFEGAQGLLLDQRYGYFPHVTRSNTGLTNIVEFLNKIGDYKDLKVNYVTRSYTTRHGNGPLNNEEDMPHFINDDTNIHNEFQGKLRYAPLDLNLYHSVTSKDLALHRSNDRKFERIDSMTCLDQLYNDSAHTFNYLSNGPTKDDIHTN